ncbi:MAG: hypothetical protein AAB074_02400 [Planctomycetota bacterium]
MPKQSAAPESITVEFLRADGSPVRLVDLGTAFLTSTGLASSNIQRPFRVAVEIKESKAGNAFYDYAQNGVPLPDGLATFIRIEGAIIPMSKTRPSQKGYPTREGQTDIIVGGLVYKVTAYLTEGRSPYWIKVLAHKKPDTSANIAKAQIAPRGGRIL